MVVLLAGPLAEARFAGRRNHVGAHGDYLAALDIAERTCSSERARFRYTQWARQEAEDLLAVDWHRDAVGRVAAALLGRGALTGREARACVDAAAVAPASDGAGS